MVLLKKVSNFCPLEVMRKLRDGDHHSVHPDDRYSAVGAVHAVPTTHNNVDNKHPRCNHEKSEKRNRVNF